MLAAVGLAAALLFPDQHGLLLKIYVAAIFVLSLDLVVGMAGLPSLGHAAFFGMGAYAAGIFAQHFNSDPLLGLMVGAVLGGVLALTMGAFLLRYEGFTFLLLTVAASQICLNLAQKARTWTGGDDGLSSFSVEPLLGVIAFDLEGRVASAYALAVLVVFYYLLRRLFSAPFGLAVQGIHENRQRMAALGTPVFRRLLTIFGVSGVVAGTAGALSAQATSVVALDSLSFQLSAEALVMLTLGGAGRLTGALVGAALFTVLHHTAASISPHNWLAVVGLLLMACVLVRPSALIDKATKRLAGMRRRRSAGHEMGELS